MLFFIHLLIYSYCHKYVPIGREVCDSKNPPVPLCKGRTQTRLKSHELTNSENKAQQCKAFPPLKKGGQGGFRTCAKWNIVLKFAIDGK